MKISLFQRTGMAVTSFFLFYWVSLNSMLLPYAPAKNLVCLIREGFFAVFIAIFIFFGFIHKWLNYKKTSWQMIVEKELSMVSKIRRLVTVIISVPIFFGSVAFYIGSWLAYPTKFFAQTVVEKDLNCLSSETWGAPSRNIVMVKAADRDDGRVWEFPWPASRFQCPGRITIRGRSWVFGTYVTDIKEGM